MILQFVVEYMLVMLEDCRWLKEIVVTFLRIEEHAVGCCPISLERVDCHNPVLLILAKQSTVKIKLF